MPIFFFFLQSHQKLNVSVFSCSVPGSSLLSSQDMSCQSCSYCRLFSGRGEMGRDAHDTTPTWILHLLGTDAALHTYIHKCIDWSHIKHNLKQCPPKQFAIVLKDLFWQSDSFLIHIDAGHLVCFTLKSAPQLGQKANSSAGGPGSLETARSKSGLWNLHLLKYNAIFEVSSSQVHGSLAQLFLGHPDG